MKAIILAAGRGSRMKVLTNGKPKCLLNINGSSLLELQIKAIQAAGIKDIGIVTGYRRESLTRSDLLEFHNKDWESTQMVYSLNHASDWLESDDCIVSYSDIFYETEAISKLVSSDADISITYDPNWQKLWSERFDDPLSDAETFEIDSNSFLKSIGKKPKTISEIEGQYMGLIKFTPSGWSRTNALLSDLSILEIKKIDMTSLLQLLINNAHSKILALPYTGTWGEVDFEFDLYIYNNRDNA